MRITQKIKNMLIWFKEESEVKDAKFKIYDAVDGSKIYIAFLEDKIVSIEIGDK